MELDSYLLAMLVVFAGAWVQGIIGFGLAVVAAPALYLIAPELMPSALICVSLLTALLNMSRYRGELQFGSMKYAVMGRVPGSLLGIFLLTVASRDMMSLLIGVAVLMAVIASLVRFSITANRPTLLVAGFISGVTGTTSSIGGPPVALVMQNESGDTIRASMSVFFTFSNMVSLFMLAFAGLFGLYDFLLSLLLFPAVFAGNFLSRKLSSRVNQQLIRRILLVICSFAGVSALASAIH